MKVSNEETGVPSNNSEMDSIIVSLPAEILGCSLQKLSVTDRLNCERVSPHWKWILGKFGWSKQNSLNAKIVLEGASPCQRIRFGPKSLVSLLRKVAAGSSFGDKPPRNNLVELDIVSFGPSYLLRPFAMQIAEQLTLFRRLEKLDIGGFDFDNIVNFLPKNLRLLNIMGQISAQTLETLSQKCPHLEEVPFRRVLGLSYESVNSLLQKFPRQKRLSLYSLHGNLTAIGGLRELEVLRIKIFSACDEKTLEAIATGCPRLRKVCFDNVGSLWGQQLLSPLSPLAEMPNLSVLEVHSDPNGALTDTILEAIARRGKLKRLVARGTRFGDSAIVFTISRCKSLVSLDLSHCQQITDRSLEAVIVEVGRRHGMPPLSLPTDRRDPGIFYFNFHTTNIDARKARRFAAGNPWLRVEYDDPRDII